MSQLLGGCVEGAVAGEREKERLLLQDQPTPSQESLTHPGPQRLHS